MQKNCRTVRKLSENWCEHDRKICPKKNRFSRVFLGKNIAHNAVKARPFVRALREAKRSCGLKLRWLATVVQRCCVFQEDSPVSVQCSTSYYDGSGWKYILG